MAGKLRRLGVSTARFSKMVGISQPAMRLIVLGVNKPRPETEKKMTQILGHLPSCPTCGRAFLEEDEDGERSAAAKRKSKKGKQ